MNYKILKSLGLFSLMIFIGYSSTKSHTSKNEEIVKAYIQARNNYDIQKLSDLVEENYTETFIDGTKEIENRKQLLDMVLWGKELNSHIKLLKIKSDGNSVITVEENTNYLDIALKRKSRKFKIVYTLGENKIQYQTIDTISGYRQIMGYNWERYSEFLEFCQQNNLTCHYQSLNKESGADLRKVLERYKVAND